MTFPLSLSFPSLVAADVARFANVFSRALAEFFPCRAVELLGIPFTQSDTLRLSPLLPNLVATLQLTGKPAVTREAEECIICLPLWGGDVLFGAALLRGVDQELSDVSKEWLLEQSILVSREFQYIKQGSLDPVTGLLNGFYLQSEIEILLSLSAPAMTGALQERDEAHSLDTVLAFLEVYPTGRDADRGLEYIVRAGSYLSSLLGQSVPLHHLGAGVFGLLWYGVTVEQARKMGDILLRRLKRENFSRAHLGMTAVIPSDPDQPATAARLIEQAWQALRKARKRGTFSLFSHATRQEEELHPLRKDSPTTSAWLRRHWRGKTSFALVLVRQDQEAASNHFTKRLRATVDDQVPLLFVNQREAFLFLDNFGEKEAGAWVEGFREKMIEFGGSTFSTGIALYPCDGFRKSNIPQNCRKAMLHAGFYGPGAVVFFDAVSLNISGDVYYNEGDLRRAVREYRRGLSISPENLNLLNSLGVAYVQLNRPGMAIAVFEKVLSVDAKNFMALLNLGFVFLNDRKQDSAVEFFEKALEIEGAHFDLLLHLGGLYCQQGRYAEAKAVLRRCVDREGDPDLKDGDYGRAYRYLGIAWEESGNRKQAVSCFEKAIGLNARDAEALSRLGRLYLLEKQGDDIALSLCRQAVELESANSDHWFRLGWVLGEQGYDQEAMETFRECLKVERNHRQAIFALARLYEKSDKKMQAKQMDQRLRRLVPESAQALKAY